MPAPFFPNSSCLARAIREQTALALSVVKLFKSGFVPTTGTTVAMLDAQECDYTTYAPATLTAWNDPIKADGGGYEISPPSVQFDLAADPAVGNSVGGYWVELAGGTLYTVKLFDEPEAMLAAGDGFPVQPVVIFGNGQ